MKIKTFFSLIFILSAWIAAAQYTSPSASYRNGSCKGTDRCPRNTLFHETQYDFSTLGINSINLDHTLACTRTYLTSFRIGVNYLSFPDISGAGIPAEICYMYGRGAWMLELAAGLNSLYVYKNYSSAAGSFSDNAIWAAVNGRAGIRFERKNSIFLRAGFVPSLTVAGKKEIETLDNKNFMWNAALGIGYTF
jgi:hypothetical protein